MQRFLWVALALICSTLAGAASAQAERRIALLIGNQDYDASVGRLKNPHNDISIVGQALVAQGFELIPPIMEASALANDPKWSPVFLIGFESTDKKGFAGIEIQAPHRQTPLIVGTKVRDEAVTGHGHVERFKKTLDLREKLTVEMSWATEGRLLVRVNGSEYRELARAANLSALKVLVSTGDLGIENLVLGHRR